MTKTMHATLCCLMLAGLLCFLPACSAEPTEPASTAGASNTASVATDASADAADEPTFHNADLGNDWKVVDSLDLQYATGFTVDYYEGGYKLACLSDGGRYLTVPEGASAPEGIDADIVVLQQPIDHVYLVASDTMCLFDALDEMDAIAVSGIAKENWHIPAAIEAMENGSIVYGGKYSAPDYDTLLAQGCELSIQSTMINHTPDVREKLIELGIPVLTEQSSYESEPLGRTEWIKLYGALFDKEDVAAKLFDAQVEKAQSAIGTETGKTVAFFYINSNGAAVVRKPGDYVTKMISLAGGDYVFSDLGDDSATSTVTLEMETFYAQAKDADIIIYNATIDSGVNSIDELVMKNELLGNFAAVQNGNVWVTSQDMYQQMMATGDVISDFNAVFTGSDDDLTYLQKLE
ncbi:ABC-type enterochelin transport system, periplasmic component [Slackia heliotrinireducens]|uniref:ABC-type Fe3+-hydroxamate transport system, periplasmic component n=1 Tax=Slackia heliotrinireducens (strain ATCC 29202 / DSM 20476 / NCTC 11029 / RHS 1) TaxID=471855 RepID=C7N213_SLAHD|nr:ABC transporter substrate-binding protein [Slackia heliotrinireducens]ACV23454.1 ABC-type Fe3+-hydroxamate transport system, periplasmic component [Slackia heliotrinireducens DSM 20476]VEH02774.1 ABC-type enterochelin transport system, periplasmic component [Slackia heliotrinireducens]